MTDQGLTSVLSVKTLRDENQVSQFEFLGFMADCVIRLDHRVVGQVATRRLRVIKYRGSGFGTQRMVPTFWRARIFVLFPLTTAGTDPSAARGKGLHGIEGTGSYVEWRIPRASYSHFGQQRRGQDHAGEHVRPGRLPARRSRVLYLKFEESKEAMISGMLSPGIDLRPSIRDEKLLIQTAMPESTGSDNHLNRIMETIDSCKPNHLILDDLLRMRPHGVQAIRFDFMMRLVSVVKEQGILPAS